MIVKRINHFGIVVKNIDKHLDVNFKHLFNTDFIGQKIFDPLQKANVLFIKIDGGTIELVEPIDETSPVFQFVKKKPAGYHHICIEVENIDDALKECEKNRQLIVSSPKPAIAFNNRRIAFVVGPDRLLWELLEAKG